MTSNKTNQKTDTEVFEAQCQEDWNMTLDEVVLARIVYSNKDILYSIHHGKAVSLNKLTVSNGKMLKEAGVILLKADRIRKGIARGTLIDIDLLEHYLALPCNQFDE